MTATTMKLSNRLKAATRSDRCRRTFNRTGRAVSPARGTESVAICFSGPEYFWTFAFPILTLRYGPLQHARNTT